MDELLKNNLNFNTSYRSMWSLVEPFIKHLFSVCVCRWCSLELSRPSSPLSALPQLWLSAWRRTAVQHLTCSVSGGFKDTEVWGGNLTSVFPSHLNCIQTKPKERKLSLCLGLGLAVVAINFLEYCSNFQVFLDNNHISTLFRLWLPKWSLL